MSRNKPNSFSQAFALLLVYNQKEKHFIFEDKSVIGRSPTAFLCLEDSRISRQHCIIEKTEEDNKFTICDKSNSGTYVNGTRLIKNQVQELHNHDRINLANIDEYKYIFIINKRHLGLRNLHGLETKSPLREKMIDLNETQIMEKDSVDKELNLVEAEMCRLKEEFQEKLKAREEELERERLKVSMEIAYNKEQADKAEIKLKEILEEKERALAEHENKMSDVSKKVEELQKTKNEIEKRHFIEREELENRCKAEIEELKKRLKSSETKHQQFEELEARLEETNNILLENEMEQQRLFEAKVEVETKLESKIVHLTNEGRNKEEELKALQRKLREKEEQENKVKKEMECLEDDIMCSICAEMFVEPTVLTCGHMFCKLCINEWNKKKKICPMCRAKITTTIRLFSMDSVIEKSTRLMPEEARIRREALIEQRKRGKTPQKHRPIKKRRHEIPPAVPVRAPAHAEVSLRAPAREIHIPGIAPLPNVGFPLDSVEARHREVNQVLDFFPGDPFQEGWVNNPLGWRNVWQPPGRNSPVTVAAVDLTNANTEEPSRRARLRTHTVTSANANTTIDLTNV